MCYFDHYCDGKKLDHPDGKWTHLLRFYDYKLRVQSIDTEQAVAVRV